MSAPVGSGMRALRALLLLTVLGWAQGGYAAPFILTPLPGSDRVRLEAIERTALAPPERYKVVVLPGSGCAGMGRFAQRYFVGLLHARVLVLHKRGVHADADTAASACSPAWVQQDALSIWLADAAQAIAVWQAAQVDTAPLVLVGISEGAELLPALAAQLHPAGLVLIGSSGLDPVEAGRLQAERQGERRTWDALGQVQGSMAPDATVVQGRSLRYWRDLWSWPVLEPLRSGSWPLVQVWGQEDALVPQEAYRRFGQRIRTRAAPWCAIALPGADHGLQSPTRDGVQWLWARLERWARAPEKTWCASFEGSP